MASRPSGKMLKSLPPDPARHLDSAITHVIAWLIGNHNIERVFPYRYSGPKYCLTCGSLPCIFDCDDCFYRDSNLEFNNRTFGLLHIGAQLLPGSVAAYENLPEPKSGERKRGY